MALQLRRAKTDWSGWCKMTVQGALWLAKCYPSILISVFLTGFSYFYQVVIQYCCQEAGWTPFQIWYFPKRSRVLPGIELVTSWMTDVLISILKGRSFFLNKCSNENENDKWYETEGGDSGECWWDEIWETGEPQEKSQPYRPPLCSRGNIVNIHPAGLGSKSRSGQFPGWDFSGVFPQL